MTCPITVGNKNYPVIYLNVELAPNKTLAQVCQLLVLCLESVNILPSPDWLIEEEVAGEGLIERQLEEIFSRKDYPDEETRLSIFLDDSLTTITIEESKSGGWRIQIHFHSDSLLEEDVSRADLESLMDALIEVCRGILRQTKVRKAYLGRCSQQITIVPRLPLIRCVSHSLTHAVVTTAALVERCYEYPEVF